MDAYKGWSTEEAAQHFKVYFGHFEKVKSALRKSNAAIAHPTAGSNI
jgi:hypothetical protein